MQTFAETGLRSEILESIEKMGFIKPTPIQAETIPFLLNSDEDLVAMAQTGTGKTAAFGLQVLHKMDTESRGVQALVLSPTGGLCGQSATGQTKTASQKLVSVSPIDG